MPKDAVVTTVQASDANPDGAVQYRNLPKAEKAIARTAVSEGIYHACPEIPDDIYSFASRFDDPNAAYLTYRETTYGVYVRITDQVYAATASSPEQNPSCGGLF
jgi:hypothetical protein